MHICTCLNFSPHSFSEPLLFVNVDISDCYDTINSRKLYDIMEQILVTAAQNTVRDNINVHLLLCAHCTLTCMCPRAR